MKNPFIQSNKTILKVALLCSKEKTWALIGTPKGLASWFPTSCKGEIAKGKTIEFGWVNGESEGHQVLDVLKLSFVETTWLKDSIVRYTMEGKNPVIVKLETTYPKTKEGKEAQLLDISSWAFFLANLKSIASGGVDLRNKNPKYSWKDAFLD